MKERERTVVTGLVVLMLSLWLGFLFHQSPRFAGSFWGGVLAVVGGILMLVPLAYLFVKRIKWLKTRTKKYVSMRTLLAWHVYAGIVGPILVLLHTGHKFVSPLGIVLTAMTIIVVISGFIGRYLMNQISTEIREKKATLKKLETYYQQSAIALSTKPEHAQILQPFSGFFSRLFASFFIHDNIAGPNNSQSLDATSPTTMLHLSESIADVEYAIKTHSTFKEWFGKWLKIHIVISMILYVLMALHIWGAIHFGIRWFDPWRTSTSHFTRATIENGGNKNGGNLSRFSPLINPSDEKESTEAVEQFSRHFGQLFRKYWHEPVIINGIKTTVFNYAGIAKEIDQPESDFSKAESALKQVNPYLLGGGNLEKAFWINVYNFGAMKLASENYPVTSITDPKISEGDPWGIEIVQMGNNSYSLKQIENAILLKKFNDPRIVFAISCAAVSCPDRTGEIFSDEKLDQQLEGIVYGLLSNTTKGLAIDQQRKVVTLSWILKADKRLFGDGSNNGLLDFVKQYSSSEMVDWIDTNRSKIKVDFFKHDWSLNDIALKDKEIRIDNTNE